jgi:hypothetical protein
MRKKPVARASGHRAQPLQSAQSPEAMLEESKWTSAILHFGERS